MDVRVRSGGATEDFVMTSRTIKRLFRQLAAAATLVFLAIGPVQAQYGVPQGSPLDPSLSGQGQQSNQNSQNGQQNGSNSDDSSNNNGNDTSRTFEPVPIGSDVANPYSTQDVRNARESTLDQAPRLKSPAQPGEFETFVAKLLGRKLPRYGADLLLPSSRDFAQPATATVPADYRLKIGDMLAISLKGSIAGSVEREIDTNGNIFLDTVGSVHLAGVRYADVRDRISAAIGTEYRDYSVTVEVKRLRGIRVYVTGFANNPGAFSVSSLSTMVNAVFQAGGPSQGGSFRSVKLYRSGREVADLDLYDFLRGGNRVNDAVLENEDVLFIPPAGEQVAVIGSVQNEAIYEMKPGETIEQTLAVAGGTNVLGDPERLILYRTADHTRPGPQEIARGAAASLPILGGDILQVLSQGSLVQPVEQQSVLVRVEGEVGQPGNFFVPPNTSMATVLQMAGGMTQRAFPYGARLVRQSVRQQQREGFDDAIDQLEVTIAAAPLTGSSGLSGEDRAAQIASAQAVLEKLRQAEPDGRVVLDIAPSATTLPGEILLENNDEIFIPPRASIVGVFGAVYRPASFVIRGQPLRVRDYVERAGGPQRAADKGNIFVVRANGEVLTRAKGALGARALPGDVIFRAGQDQLEQFLGQAARDHDDLLPAGCDRRRGCLDQLTADRSIVGRLAAHRLFARAWTRGAVFATLCIVSLLLALFPQRYLASASLTPTNPESLGLSGTLSQLGAINSVFGNQAAVEIAMRVGKSVYVRDAVIAKLKLHQRLDEPSRIWLQRWLDRKVDVRSLRGGIISVEMYDHDPKLARDIVTEYSNAIRLQLAEVSRRQTTYKRDVLLDLVSGANDRLSKAQANYDAFRLTLRTSDPQSAVDSIGLRIPMLEGAIRTKQVQLNIARQLYTDNNIAVEADQG